MNHDYAHCWDYEKGVCPEDCFRAVLTEDLKNWPHPVTYTQFKGTDACPLTNPQPKPSNAERIRSMSDEELARFMVRKSQCPDGYTSVFGPHCVEENGCEECWLEWLKKETDNANPR